MRVAHDCLEFQNIRQTVSTTDCSASIPAPLLAYSICVLHVSNPGE